MLTVSRSPLSSPALRTMASASSYITAPSSPLSRPPYSTLAHAHLPTKAKTPREPHPSPPGTPVYGCYFNFVGASSRPCRFSVPYSPASGYPAPSSISMPVSSILSHGNTANTAVEQLEIGHPSTGRSSSQAVSYDNASAPVMPAEPQSRLKPTFKLAFPRQSLSRDNSFDSLALGSPFSIGTPHKLTWSDSFDSVMTLKPIKGRIPTPYPTMDEGEWIQDVEDAIKMI